MSRQRRGVYFVANDKILELVTAFLNSFRSHNPKIPMCLIPYDDDYRQVVQLQSHYGFTVWDDAQMLCQCDEISLSFHDQPKGHYRKLTAWEGEFDEFLYIDSDTAVLRNISFIFDYLDEFGFVVATSNVAGRAWKESIHEAGKLTPKQRHFAANTGFIASRKGNLRLRGTIDKLPAAVELKPHMKLGYEQPLLNYLMVTSGLPYTSLRQIRETTGDPDIPGEVFAWTPGVVAQDGLIVQPTSPPALMVHWTEPVKPTQADKESIPLYEMWEFYRDLVIEPHRP